MIEEKEKLLEEATKAIAEKDRYLGVLIEDTNHTYATILEAVDVIDKKIDGFEIRLGRRIDNLDEKIFAVDKRLDNFQTETRENFKMFFEKLSAYDDDKADKRDVVALECRAIRLEEKII